MIEPSFNVLRALLAETPANVWSFLTAVAAMISAIGVVVGPIIVSKRTSRRAEEVKADLAVAKKELKADAKKREEKLEAVHQIAANTEVLVNGAQAAKEARIRELEAQLRREGHEPAPPAE